MLVVFDEKWGLGRCFECCYICWNNEEQGRKGEEGIEAERSRSAEAEYPGMPKEFSATSRAIFIILVRLDLNRPKNLVWVILSFIPNEPTPVIPRLPLLSPWIVHPRIGFLDRISLLPISMASCNTRIARHILLRPNYPVSPHRRTWYSSRTKVWCVTYDEQTRENSGTRRAKRFPNSKRCILLKKFYFRGPILHRLTFPFRQWSTD